MLLQIPEGMVTTYKDIATALGDPSAARWIARILSENRDPEVPCYKVVMSDGSVGGYVWGVEEKIKKLEKDGIRVINGKVNLDTHRFFDFEVIPVFKIMQKAQKSIAYRNRKRSFEYEYVLAVDVSYRECTGVGAVVLYDKRGNFVESQYWTGRVTFPYVPTYLAFRENRFMVMPVKKVGMEDAILLVDGHGTAHPRKAGEAVHIGAVLDVPSIGVAKRPLKGGEPVKIGRSYVSPGWGLPDINIVRDVWFRGKRQPEPLESAHRMATHIAREITETIL